MVEHLFEAVEVEAVADEVLLDLAEEVVVLKAAEPLDPALLRVIRFFRFRHSFIFQKISIQVC